MVVVAWAVVAARSLRRRPIDCTTIGPASRADVDQVRRFSMSNNPNAPFGMPTKQAAKNELQKWSK